MSFIAKEKENKNLVQDLVQDHTLHLVVTSLRGHRKPVYPIIGGGDLMVL